MILCICKKKWNTQLYVVGYYFKKQNIKKLYKKIIQFSNSVFKQIDFNLTIAIKICYNVNKI